MTRKQRTAPIALGLAIALLTAACSGGSTAEPTPDGTGNDAQTQTQTDSVAAGSGDSAATTTEADNPRCTARASAQGIACARQITPTSWTDYHSGSSDLIASISDTKVLTSGGQDFQLWDLEDPDWGSLVEIDPDVRLGTGGA